MSLISRLFERRNRRPEKRAPSRWTYVLFRPTAPRAKRPSTPDDRAAHGSNASARPASLGPGYLVLFSLAVFAAAAAFVFHLHVRFDGIELGYATSAARARQSRLLLEQRELRLELASLKSPARVEADARERLGMAVPGHDRIIVIGEARRFVSVSGGAL
ncbi:MAG: cell division protein FtsL [Proteobacteria bacterium]|nr:cell division protein FtsL [Pseudomonadota bacterium]